MRKKVIAVMLLFCLLISQLSIAYTEDEIDYVGKYSSEVETDSVVEEDDITVEDIKVDGGLETGNDIGGNVTSGVENKGVVITEDESNVNSESTDIMFGTRAVDALGEKWHVSYGCGISASTADSAYIVVSPGDTVWFKVDISNSDSKSRRADVEIVNSDGLTVLTRGSEKTPVGAYYNKQVLYSCKVNDDASSGELSLDVKITTDTGSVTESCGTLRVNANSSELSLDLMQATETVSWTKNKITCDVFDKLRYQLTITNTGRFSYDNISVTFKSSGDMGGVIWKKKQNDGSEVIIDSNDIYSLASGESLNLILYTYNTYCYSRTIRNSFIVSIDGKDDIESNIVETQSKEYRGVGVFLEQSLDRVNWSIDTINASVGDTVYYRYTIININTGTDMQVKPEMDLPLGFDGKTFIDWSQSNHLGDIYNMRDGYSIQTMCYQKVNGEADTISTQMLLTCYSGTAIDGWRHSNQLTLNVLEPDLEVDVVQANYEVGDSDDVLNTRYTKDDLDVEKIGDLVNYKITVRNKGAGTAKNVELSDFTSDGFLIRDTSGIVSKKDILPGDEITIFRVLYVTKEGTLTAKFKVTSDFMEDWVSNELDVNVKDLTGGVPDMSIEKFQSVNGSEYIKNKLTAKEGDSVSYKIAVNNTGNVDLEELSIKDAIPTGVSEFKCYVGDDKKECVLTDKFELPVGETLVVYLDTKITSDNCTIKNKASASATGVAEKDSNEVEIEVEKSQPSMYIIKEQSVNGGTFGKYGEAHKGDSVTYKLVVVNDGNVGLKEVKITDILPEGLSPFKCYIGEDRKEFSLDNTVEIPVGEEVVLYLDTTVLIDEGTIYNTARARGGRVTANSDETELYVIKSTEPTHGIDIEKLQSLNDSEFTKSRLKGIKDDKLVYKINVTNTGEAELTDVTVKDVLPLGFVTDGELNRNIGTLAVDETKSIIISGKVLVKEGVLSNRAEVSSNETPVERSNEVVIDIEPKDEPVLPNDKPKLSIEKLQSVNGSDFTKDKLTSKKGDTVSYKINVANVGTVDAENVEVTDTLPLGIKVTLPFNGSLGTLAVGETKSIIVSGEVMIETGMLRNMAVVFADDVEQVTSNEVVIDLEEVPDIEPDKPELPPEKPDLPPENPDNPQEPDDPVEPDTLDEPDTPKDDETFGKNPRPQPDTEPNVTQVGGKTGTGESDKGKTSPKTGDTTGIVVWLILMAVSGAYITRRRVYH